MITSMVDLLSCFNRRQSQSNASVVASRIWASSTDKTDFLLFSEKLCNCLEGEYRGVFSSDSIGNLHHCSEKMPGFETVHYNGQVKH